MHLSERKPELIGIGEFSRLTHLSLKQLRNYHEIGLLVPAAVDPFSGYRRYLLDQADQARVIQRLRAVDVPVSTITKALTTGDTAALIDSHLRQIQSRLRDQEAAIASLRRELTNAPPAPVDFRHSAGQRVIGTRAVVEHERIGEWCNSVFPKLAAQLAAHGAVATGPGGADYSSDFFTDGAGEVFAWFPIPDDTSLTAALRGSTEVLTPGPHAVSIHRGAYDFDHSYSDLGSHVHRYGPAQGFSSATRPIREIYLVGPHLTDDPHAWLTELWWPLDPIPHTDRPDRTQPQTNPTKRS